MFASLQALYKQHRHVAVKIESNWGTSRCDDLFYDYLIKNRDERSGFCPSMYKEILNLYIIHNKIYGSKHSVMTNCEELNVDVT